MINQMANLKPIKPSLRERKRYVVYEVLKEGIITDVELFESINRACLEFMGIMHMGNAGVLIIRNQSNENRGIIKINNKYVDYLKASLMLIKEIEGKKVSVRVVGISGILKKARDKFMAKNCQDDTKADKKTKKQG